jgi:hypothetical protein
VVVSLAHPELDTLSTEESGQLFADLESRVIRALDAARETKESTFGSFDLLVARIGQHNIMKVLTLVTVILLPATVLGGIIGINPKVGLLRPRLALLGRGGDDAPHCGSRTLARPGPPLDLTPTSAQVLNEDCRDEGAGTSVLRSTPRSDAPVRRFFLLCRF